MQAVFMVIILAAICSGRRINWNPQQSAWERSGQFEGDIKLTPLQQRNGLKDTTKRWLNKTLPYAFGPDFNEAEKAKILEAVNEYNSKTCIHVREFIPGVDKDYVQFRNDKSGCWSYVGRIGGRQVVNLGTGCLSLGTIEHEMLHALGFFHMQSATDRDNYVTIHYENIQSGAEGNFNKYSSSQITSFGVPYDYSSIMHYGAYAFSKNGEKTIEPKDTNAKIGLRGGFSENDIKKLVKMYNCTCKWE